MRKMTYYLISLAISISAVIGFDPCQTSENSFTIPLVAADESGANMVTCEEGLKYLREELGDRKLYINVIAGPARRGKSFFLNNVAQISNDNGSGFSVGHEAEGHTKGFWITRKNEIIKSQNGEEVALVFMDTEGFGAVGNLNSYDPKLCAIAAMLASNLFYNVMSEISMDNIQFLSSIASFDDFFSQKHGVSFPTPPLTWIVQDWDHPMTQYNPQNEYGYLNFVLQKKDLSNVKNTETLTQLEKYNDLLDCLSRKFEMDQETRNALPPIVLLDHPSRQTRKTELTKLSFNEYSETYQSQIKSLRANIKDGASPKVISGQQHLTGKTLADTLKALTSALNQLSEVGDALVKTVAKDASVTAFNRFLDSSSLLPTPSDSYLTYKDGLAFLELDALEYFKNNSLGKSKDPINEEINEQLVKDIQNEQRVLTQRNFNNAFDRCAAISVTHIDTLRRVGNKKNSIVCLTNYNNVNPLTNDILMQLSDCYDVNTKEFSRICSPEWCEAQDVTCVTKFTHILGNYTERMDEIFLSRKKDLATQGFNTLFMYIFTAWIFLFIVKMFFYVIRIEIAIISRLRSTFMYANVLFMLLSVLEGVSFFQDKVCNRNLPLISDFESKCVFWTNETPKIIGDLFNSFILLSTTLIERARNVTENYEIFINTIEEKKVIYIEHLMNLMKQTNCSSGVSHVVRKLDIAGFKFDEEILVKQCENYYLKYSIFCDELGISKSVVALVTICTIFLICVFILCLRITKRVAKEKKSTRRMAIASKMAEDVQDLLKQKRYEYPIPINFIIEDIMDTISATELDLHPKSDHESIKKCIEGIWPIVEQEITTRTNSAITFASINIQGKTRKCLLAKDQGLPPPINIELIKSQHVEKTVDDVHKATSSDDSKGNPHLERSIDSPKCVDQIHADDESDVPQYAAGRANKHNSDNSTPLLLLAAAAGNMDICTFLVTSGANVNHCSQEGINPLLAAFQNGHYSICKLLIDNGADPNIVARENGISVLSLAAVILGEDHEMTKIMKSAVNRSLVENSVKTDLTKIY